SDTGIGIAPEDIEKVLRPFGQVESALARRFAGTGLGLPLSKGLAELHGGTLSISSRPGAGTTVTVRQPPHPPLPYLRPGIAAPRASPALSKARADGQRGCNAAPGRTRVKPCVSSSLLRLSWLSRRPRPSRRRPRE